MIVQSLFEKVANDDENLVVDADLSIEVEGAKLRLVGEGRVLTLKFESASDLWGLYRRRRNTVNQRLLKWLAQSGLTVSVVAGDRTIAVVGDQANPSFPTDLFHRMDHLQLKLGSLSIQVLSYLNPLG